MPLDDKNDETWSLISCLETATTFYLFPINLGGHEKKNTALPPIMNCKLQKWTLKNKRKNCTQEWRKSSTGYVASRMITISRIGGGRWTENCRITQDNGLINNLLFTKWGQYVHRSHMAWKMGGLCFNQCNTSLSSGDLCKTASNIGLPKIFGEFSNNHIRSLGHGLWGCFSWGNNRNGPAQVTSQGHEPNTDNIYE